MVVNQIYKERVVKIARGIVNNYHASELIYKLLFALHESAEGQSVIHYPNIETKDLASRLVREVFREPLRQAFHYYKLSSESQLFGVLYLSLGGEKPIPHYSFGNLEEVSSSGKAISRVRRL
ncbi:hypothetical protein HYU23_00455 [Candidatus Woesearchaeota archaeon]|nr:hypothetical protein [Candidatus Woesearchaeota archaeon]